MAGAPPAPTDLSIEVLGSVLALGALGTGLAFVLNFRVIRVAGASTSASVTYLIPVVATVLGVLVLGEHLSWYQPVGAVDRAGRRRGVAGRPALAEAPPRRRARGSSRTARGTRADGSRAGEDRAGGSHADAARQRPGGLQRRRRVHSIVQRRTAPPATTPAPPATPRAASNHTRAASNHTRAASNHTRAASNHTRAASNHTRAASNHTRAASNHTRAASNHTRAASNHTRAASNHTRADHGVPRREVRNWGTRRSNHPDMSMIDGRRGRA